MVICVEPALLDSLTAVDDDRVAHTESIVLLCPLAPPADIWMRSDDKLVSTGFFRGRTSPRNGRFDLRRLGS